MYVRVCCGRARKARRVALGRGREVRRAISKLEESVFVSRAGERAGEASRRAAVGNDVHEEAFKVGHEVVAGRARDSRSRC